MWIQTCAESHDCCLQADPTRLCSLVFDLIDYLIGNLCRNFIIM